MKKEQLKELIKQELQSVLTEGKTDKTIMGKTYTAGTEFVVRNANHPKFDKSTLKKIESILKSQKGFPLKQTRSAFEKAFPGAKIRVQQEYGELDCITVSTVGGNSDFAVYPSDIKTSILPDIKIDGSGKFTNNHFRAK